MTLAPAIPVNVMDTVGAGDVFASALAAGYEGPAGLLTTLRFASAAGSLPVTQPAVLKWRLCVGRLPESTGCRCEKDQNLARSVGRAPN